MTCKQCGYMIVEAERSETRRAQAEGFCSVGCQVSYDWLKKKTLEDAGKGL